MRAVSLNVMAMFTAPSAADVLAEAHALGITDEELAAEAMPPMDVLIAQMLAAPLSFRTTWNSPKCYTRAGFEVHVQPSCRC